MLWEASGTHYRTSKFFHSGWFAVSNKLHDVDYTFYFFSVDEQIQFENMRRGDQKGVYMLNDFSRQKFV